MTNVTPFRPKPKNFQTPGAILEVVEATARKATVLHWALFGLREVQSTTSNDLQALGELVESIESDLEMLAGELHEALPTSKDEDDEA